MLSRNGYQRPSVSQLPNTQLINTSHVGVFVSTSLSCIDPVESSVSEAVSSFLSEKGIPLRKETESDLMILQTVSKRHDYAKGVFKLEAEVQLQFVDRITELPVNVIKLKGEGVGDSPLATARSLIEDLLTSLEAPLADAVTNSVEHYSRAIENAN